MLLFLLTSVAFASQQWILFSDQFTGKEISKEFWRTSKNAVIVPCPGRTDDQCINLVKQDIGGSLFSIPIEINESGLDVTVEFSYLTKSSKKRGTSSSLFVGYTDASQSGFCWFASGYSYRSSFFIATSGRDSDKYLCKNDESVLIQDLLDDWKTIKYTIPAKTLQAKGQKQIVLVFEDFQQEGSDPGAYYITNILAYYSKGCTSACKECTTFYDCTSCDEKYYWLEGRCYKVECGDSLEQSIPYGRDTLTESATSTSYTAVITIPDYGFLECWPAQWVTLDLSNGKFTELDFWYDSFQSASMSIGQSNISNYNCMQDSTNANKYSCMFHFNVHFNEQIMYEKNWTAIIDFSASSVKSDVLKFNATNLPALVIPIESSLEYCTNVDECVWTTGNINLTLNQRFMVKLTLLDPNLISWTLSTGYVKLSGKGTLVALPILATDTTIPGSIIYTVRLAIKGDKGNGFAVAASVTNPNGGTRRRLLSQTDQTNTNKLAVGKIQSGIITFKSREVQIQPDPEYSPIVFISVLLLLLLGI